VQPRDIKTMVSDLEALEADKFVVVGSLNGKIKEAKQKGFHLRALGIARRLARMSEGDRVEFKTCMMIYMQALGVHDGDPLLPSARRRLDSNDPHQERDPNQADIEDRLKDGNPPPAPEPKVDDAETPEQACERGAAAHKEGRPVTANPYVFGDPRQAKWDEGWCVEDGSNGMEIPKSWQRKGARKEKKPKGDNGDDNGES
jgi:uncharacterized protein (UPF0335 family)